MAKTKYSWVPFYEELADKLLTFKSNRAELIEKVKEAHQMMGLNLPKIEKDNDNIPDIDPFTVIALFNRGKQSVASRQKICEGYKNVFGMTNSVPSDYDGVPMYFYNQYCFYRYVGDPKRDDACFDYFWNLFEQALSYAKDRSNKSAFEAAFEQVMKISLVGQPKLTMGLFHIRPNVFVNLDSNNNALIEKELHRTVGTFSGAEYLDLCSSVVDYTKAQLNGSLPDFSGRAYELKQQTVAAKENEWEPPLEQYDPKLTKDDWITDALYKLKNFENGELVQKNAVFMDYLQNGIPVRYVVKGEERASICYLVDYKNPENNSFIVANQWTFIENSNKRPDTLLNKPCIEASRFFLRKINKISSITYGVEIREIIGKIIFGGVFCGTEYGCRER